MISYIAIRDSALHETPFRWGVIENVFVSSEIEKALAGEFPTEGYECCKHGDGVYFRRQFIRLNETGPCQGESLAQCYRELAVLLLSKQYRSAISELISVGLDGAPLEAVFWRYDHATKFVSHRDIPTKLVTQVFYLNEIWRPEWGGTLNILRSENKDDIAYELAPRLGASTIVVRSDTSWHLVSQISREAPEPRNTLTVHFHLPGTKAE